MDFFPPNGEKNVGGGLTKQFSQLSSLKGVTTNSNALPSFVLHLKDGPDDHVYNGLRMFKHFSNAVWHGLVNPSLREIKYFLKGDLNNLDIAVKPEVSRHKGTGSFFTIERNQFHT